MPRYKFAKACLTIFIRMHFCHRFLLQKNVREFYYLDAYNKLEFWFPGSTVFVGDVHTYPLYANVLSEKYFHVHLYFIKGN